MAGSISESPRAADRTAAAIRSGPESLSRNPEAPAAMPSNRCSSSSKVVMSTTAQPMAGRRCAGWPRCRRAGACGCPSRRRRVSGRGHRRTASSPSALCPTTSMSGSASSIAASPARAIGWSSTTSTRRVMTLALRRRGSASTSRRAKPVPTRKPSRPRCRCRCRRRQLGPDLPSPLGARHRGQRAAERPDPIAQGREAGAASRHVGEPLAGRARVGHRDDPVVPDVSSTDDVHRCADECSIAFVRSLAHHGEDRGATLGRQVVAVEVDRAVDVVAD